MSKSIVESLTTSRISLLLKHPFFGNIATRLKLVEATDWCSTVATDGRNFFYNVEFVKQFDIRQLEFIFAHEICHCILDHFSHVGKRRISLVRIAQDYVVNQLLVDEKIGKSLDPYIDIYQDDKYRDMSWEEVYDDLLTENEERLQQIGKLVDEHLDVGLPSENTTSITISPHELDQIRDEIKYSMIQSLSVVGASNVPMHIRRIIQDLTEPKISWRELIQHEIQSIITNNYSFAIPNKKSASGGIVLPSLCNGTAIDVVAAIDMSGSISAEDASVFIGEVKNIIEQYDDYTINLWCFDTAIHNHKVITVDTREELSDYVPEGSGGTDFTVNWEFMKDNNIVPKKFIMLTDGEPADSWGDPDYCDTIFIIKGNQSIQSPFGTSVTYERDL